MKTEFIDVSDTQKNLVVEIPSTVVDAGDRQGRARLQQGRADSGLPARQGAGQGRAAALSRPDPARRGARADPARRGRGAARARRRAGRHAGHPGRRRRRGSAAEVHGDLRDGAADRAGRLRAITLRRSTTVSRRRRRRGGAVGTCASAPRATSRSRIAGIQTGDSVVMDLVRTAMPSQRPTSRSGARGRTRAADAGATESDKHENVTVDIGASREPARLRRRARRPARPAQSKTFDVQLSGRLRHQGAGRDDGQLRRRRSRRSASASCRSWTTSSRRTSGDFASLDALRDAGAARTSSTRRRTRRSARCAANC